MNIKQKKYYNIIQLYKLLNLQKTSISLVIHLSDLNVMQANILKSFCDGKDIKFINIKLNLLRKLTKNPLFINLFSGPTRILFFKDLETFQIFIKQMPFNEKIIPLSVIYNNTLFSYPFFKKRINEYESFGNLSKVKLQEKLIVNLKTKNSVFLRNLNYNTTNFLHFLTHLKNLKKN